MNNKHFFSLVLGIILIFLGLSIIPAGIYYSNYILDNFPEVSFDYESHNDDFSYEYYEEKGLLESIASKIGIDKAMNKINDILENQKKLKQGYNESFYSIQAEIKYVMKMQIVYLVVTAGIVSIVFIFVGIICIVIHKMLVYQSKTYLLEENIRKDILTYKEDRK